MTVPPPNPTPTPSPSAPAPTPAAAPPPCPPYVYVDTPAGVAALGEALAGEKVIGLDTESDSMYVYFEKVCIIQVVLPGDRIWIVDTIRVKDLAPLKGPLEDPAVRKVLHGSDYDIVCLKRDFGISLRGTFCTMTSGMLLGLPKFGLADLIEVNFGVRLAKTFTKSDWAARPLSPGQMEYLVQDVQFLLPLADLLDVRLRAADLFEEVAIEFERLERRQPAPREPDPWMFLRVRGARTLPERGRAVMRALVDMRERKSRELDRPPFKVLANETLLKIAELKPDSEHRLRGIRGITPYVLRRFGEEILAAVKQGVEDPETVPDRAPHREGGDSEERRMSFAAQKRHGRLKEWRSERAAKIGRTTLSILPNPAMFEVAKDPPRDVAALARIEGVGPHRAKLHGDEILRILHGKKRSDAAAPGAPGESPEGPSADDEPPPGDPAPRV